MVEAADGWLALSLARAWDWEAAPAWLEAPVDDWEAVERAIADRPSGVLLDRAELLGLAVAAVDAEQGPCPSPTMAAASLDGVTVVDLSSLWAGPLCGFLLAERGARVLKVESVTRRDGARDGDPELYEALNASKQLVLLDLGTGPGRRELDRVLSTADVVVEASRPRALGALGWDPARAEASGCAAWVSITGYGRSSDRVAFGDDAAAGAGLVRWLDGEPAFLGDALADPVAGMTAAAAVLDGFARGGRHLHDVSLVGAARSVRS
jgi:crotonobetainyl-CoA:carnitine CoA-transferase CaiB-like acyl-CoA transferase